ARSPSADEPQGSRASARSSRRGGCAVEGIVQREPAIDPLHPRRQGDVRLGAQRADTVEPIRAVAAARRAAPRGTRRDAPRGANDLLFARPDQCPSDHLRAARALLPRRAGAEAAEAGQRDSSVSPIPARGLRCPAVAGNRSPPSASCPSYKYFPESPSSESGVACVTSELELFNLDISNITTIGNAAVDKEVKR